MKPRANYTVTFTRDAESGWWIAEAKEAKGCVTQGRTIEQARERMREALQAFFDLSKPYSGELIDDVALMPEIRKAVLEAIHASQSLTKAQLLAALKNRVAVERLTGVGLSFRDAGEMLGLTRQRAHQLAALAAKSGRRTARGRSHARKKPSILTRRIDG